MTIRKRTPKTYLDFRAAHWEKQGRDANVNFRAATLASGKPLDGVYLQPKKILFYKDVWHCPDLKSAKKIAKQILEYGDVSYLELKGERWVFVDFRGNIHELPGQETDKRENIKGR